MKIKLFAAAFMSLSLVTLVFAQVNREGNAPTSNAPAAAQSSESKKMSITRSGARTPSKGPEVNFTGNVSDEQYGNQPSTSQGAKDMNKEPSAIKKNFGDFSPKLVELTDDVLFGDVWERVELSKRDRSLVTVTALIVGGNTEQLPFHLNRARENGVTEAELIETITHLAFYSGWPKAMSAITVAKDVFKKQP
jgi:4-carboxymuconolactone decarboxylase